MRSRDFRNTTLGHRQSVLEDRAALFVDLQVVTAVEALIHHPTDASLLWDSVRVLNRLLRVAQKRYPEAVAAYHDRTRASKKLARNIDQARRDDERKVLYRRLVRYTEEVAEYARKALVGLRALRLASSEAVRRDLLAEQLSATLDLARRVISQTRRRVFQGQKVPAAEKVVSIFEPHTDIIEKGQRETVFGHKVCLTVGDSPLIFDCQIVDGNRPTRRCSNRRPTAFNNRTVSPRRRWRRTRA